MDSAEGLFQLKGVLMPTRQLLLKAILLLVCYCLQITHLHAGETHHAHDNSSSQAIHLSDSELKRNKITLLIAGPHTILKTRDVLGKVVPNANKTLYLHPRYSGIIQSMAKNLGDKVKKGETLVTIESDQTLQIYSIKAPFSGFIVQKKANIGEHVKQGYSIYQLADLSDVWVDLFIYRKNAKLVKKGQRVIVFTDNDNKNYVSSVISYVSPLGVEHNQTMLARAVFPNNIDKNLWLLGLYVDAQITIKQKAVPIAVNNDAIQTMSGKPVIFIKRSSGFEPVNCKLGMQGKAYTQVLSGVSSGQQYATNNSFLLKAQLEKESASHSH